MNKVPTSDSASSLENPKKTKRKVSNLTIPLIDPILTEDEQKIEKDKEDEFNEYLEALLKSPHPALSRSTSEYAPTIAANDAFDHLDKLYKLMEQMLALREQNVLMQRKIMDLERLQDLHSRFVSAAKNDYILQDDRDIVNAENFLLNILMGNKKDTKHKRSLLRKSRSKNASMNVDNLSDRRFSGPSRLSDKQSKVSKWTKVKAAFKWEKASPTVSDAKSQDSGLGGMQPVNFEVARYLRVPSTSDELGTSPADSCVTEISTPGTLSSASSAEEIHRNARRRTHEDTSDDEQLYTYIPISKDDSSSSNKASKSHRTTWAKMKDIIQTQTRNSFKKKHRLSAKSDDFKIDESIGSDNEDVFEPDEPKSPTLIVQSPSEINLALSLEHNIPFEVISRYQANEDNLDISKWDKVKKAFLSSPSINRNENSSPTNSDVPTIKRDPNPTKETDAKLHAEIQRNYLELQKKLSQEFQLKLQEWERNKLSSPSTSASSNMQTNTTPEETKDLAFKKKMEEWERIKSQPKSPLQSENNLPPEFRKKLQEWNKIKKSSMKEEGKKKSHQRPRWKSVGGHRGDKSPDGQQLSEDFIKKYESWKQIKSGKNLEESEQRPSSIKRNKTPSPRLIRKDGSAKKTIKEDKELQWFEKELVKIEREKQKLERDRQKFLDREEKLEKIRRSVVGGNKKEVLVHTPSGFHRFEGISRKFTQKLVEWEKAQGIKPEESTFALLNTSCIPHIRSKINPMKLLRSKSADSIMNPELSTCPLHSQQPSSLSLNDVENFEKEILLEGTSIPDINGFNDNIDSEEPEALIVEVEDVVVETASFLENSLEKYFPIYQKQEYSNMCEGETRAAPTIRRSESARAQANYNLIEEIMGIIKILVENEKEIEAIESKKMMMDSIIIIHSEDDGDVNALKTKQNQQKDFCIVLKDKFVLLQEENTKVAAKITKDEPQFAMGDVLDTVQEITSDSSDMVETICQRIAKRNKNQLETDAINSSKQIYPEISENLYNLNMKILELRRNLSYICTASDMSVVSVKRKSSGSSHTLRKIPSIERKRTVFKKSRSKEDSQDEFSERKYDKNSSPRSDLSRQVEQGAIKKRIRYRQKGMHSKNFDESDDDDDENATPEQRKPKPRRMRSQNSTESSKSIIEKEKEEVIVDPVVIEKIVVPTKTRNFLHFEESIQSEPLDSPVTVFVKTTRKLFTPILAASEPPIETRSDVIVSTNVTHLPPLPASPTPQRKAPKEISPNIRLMMVLYNQKISDEQGAPRSAGSSGSASPVAWRSPVLERRVKAQTERYQQELQKISPLLGGRKAVQKSASMGVVVSGKKQVTVHCNNNHGILKSLSAGIIESKKEDTTIQFKTIPEENKAAISSASLNKLSDVRSSKIAKAKQDFLNSPLPSTALRNQTDAIKYPEKNRLSQISVGSESSCNSSAYECLLIKSASVGMINIDPQTYKQFVPEFHADGYVSLPRSGKSNKEGLLSNITSKFRKVKMRKHKEKMNAVSTLCRQSLFVDIQTDGSQETLSEEQQSRLSETKSSTETSPSSSRSSSWIKKPKLFKSKQ